MKTRAKGEGLCVNFLKGLRFFHSIRLHKLQGSFEYFLYKKLAKSYGAEVTGVCSTSKMDLVNTLGADFVIDYKKEDFTKNGIKYDLIIDTAAYHSIKDYKQALSTNGTYVVIGGSFAITLKIMLTKPKNFVAMLAKTNSADLSFIKQLIEEGKIESFIDKTYSLADTAKAISYLESGKVRSKVIITKD